jgi:riboflavin kinase/FMN adenylyltransferase
MNKRVIALGFFDGVHLGHAKLLELTKKRAAEQNASPAVLSFDTHPDNLVRGERIKLITSAAGRVDLIERLFGINQTLIVHFSDDTMRLSWREFLDILRNELSAAGLIAGHDFRFGYGGEGDAEKLKAYCAKYNISCDIVDQVKLGGVTVSSTLIRGLIERGDMERATAFLGHPHTLVDTVRYGYRLGGKIGAPTINMRFPEGVLVPALGVYVSRVQLEDGLKSAVTNIGVRPTVSGGESVSVESFILDYSGDLYGRQVRVEFYKFIRPEKKFSDIAELKEQITKDTLATREYFAKTY